MDSTRSESTRENNFIPNLISLDAPFFLLAAMSFVSQLGVAVMLPLIPLYATSLGASPWQLGLLTSAFALTSAIGQLGAGVLMDRLGARGFICAGMALYAGANVLIATAFDALSLIAYRALAGFGGGANTIATRVYLAQRADPKRMAFVNGVLSAAASSGTVAGPALGGVVAALSDLRAPFLLVGATSGLAFLGSLFLPRPQEEVFSQADARGGALGSIMNRSATVLLLSQFFLLAGYGAFITTFAPLATTTLGWSTLEVGITFSVFSLGGIVLGPWLAHLADIRGRRQMAMLSAVPTALYWIVLVVGVPLVVIYPAAVVAGGMLAGYMAAWFALLSEAAPGARRGRTFGVVNALSQLGIVAGAMAASALWQSANVGVAMLSGSFSLLLASAVLIILPPSSKATGCAARGMKRARW